LLNIKLQQTLKYIFIGILNYIIGYSIFFLLVQSLKDSLHYNWILFISFVLSTPISHLNQRRFVWHSGNNYFPELSKFIVANIPTISFNLALLPFFVSVLEFPILETQLFLGGGIVLATFLAHKYWTFK